VFGYCATVLQDDSDEHYAFIVREIPDVGVRRFYNLRRCATGYRRQQRALRMQRRAVAGLTHRPSASGQPSGGRSSSRIGRGPGRAGLAERLVALDEDAWPA
jgi:hypothetical protein